MLRLGLEPGTSPSRGGVISNFTNRAMVAIVGIEPTLTAYETVVLPLYDTAIILITISEKIKMSSETTNYCPLMR